jgi:Icc-related predicted phosphoesterase
MYILGPLLVTLLSLSRNNGNRSNSRSARNKRVAQKNAAQVSINDKRMRWALETDAVFLIDLENVRGKSQFELTHRELLKRTTIWTKANNLHDRVSLIVDHGSVHSSYYLPEGGLSVTFAGTRMKADDVLARDVPYFDRNTIVITADNDLMSRCRNAMERAEGDNAIVFINPIKFISDLENLMNRVERDQSGFEDEASGVSVIKGGDEKEEDEPVELNAELATQIDQEIKLRGSLYETETAMRDKKNMNTPKKRRKLEKRARQLCERLAITKSLNIDHLTTLNGISTYDRKFQDEVLSQWEKLRQSATRREMTGDRILLAEYFRRQVEIAAIDEAKLTTNDNKEDSQKKGSFSYTEYINSLAGINMATSTSSSGLSSEDSSNVQYSGEKGSVRLVVVSDTHGYEESLTPSGTILPPGDILLHLGDFAIDSGLKKKKKAIERFDQWLARQPHRTKIVLRGNHDPFKVDFPQSNANFVSMPKSIAIDGKLTMTLVPYSSPRKLSSSWRKMPMYCDILASHSPPHRILDKCYNGANAGCASLRGKVERMIAGPPKLWLCGHIHEGRGMEEVAFGISPRETVVINAANANTGRATNIRYGPIVIDVHENEEMTIVQGDGIIDEKTASEGVEEPALAPVPVETN